MKKSLFCLFIFIGALDTSVAKMWRSHAKKMKKKAVTRERVTLARPIVKPSIAGISQPQIGVAGPQSK